MPFRQDREALRQRVNELEEELSRLRGEKRDHATLRLAELEAEVRAACADADEKTSMLTELAEKLGRVRAELGSMPLAVGSAETDDSSPAPLEKTRAFSSRPPEEHARRASRTRFWIAGAACAIVALGVWWLLRSRGGSAGLTGQNAIIGSPKAIDPHALLDRARALAKLRESELSGIQAEVVAGGVVDLDQWREGAESPLSYYFQNAETAAKVSVERDGLKVVSSPRGLPHQGCGATSRGGGLTQFPCGTSVPSPRCTFRQIWEIARGAGARNDDRLFVMYARTFGENGKPVWTVIADQRGRLEIEDARCERPPRQNIQPPARPVSEIPGAPHAVDPLGILQLARSHAGLDPDAVLTEIHASYVGKGGRVDFDAPSYKGSVVYTFADPEPARDPSLPLGVVAPDSRRVRTVFVGKDGMPVTSNSYDGELYAGLARVGVKAPRCSLDRVLGLADAPAGSVAQMTYRAIGSAAGEAGRWTIDVRGTATGRTVDDTRCALDAGR